MNDIAVNALDAAVRRAISYADVRLVETEERHVSTKNGQIGELAQFHVGGRRDPRTGSWLMGIRGDR